MTARRTWKQRESNVANFFHGERTPLSGGNSKITRSDVIHDELFIECKLKKKHAVISLWDATNREIRELMEKGIGNITVDNPMSRHGVGVGILNRLNLTFSRFRFRFIVRRRYFLRLSC